jgi:DNA-binding NtrC family response regulator
MGAKFEKEKILIVDDDRALCEALKQALEGKYRVKSVSSGEEALKTLYALKPSLIIMDYKLPGMDGLETLRKFSEFDPSLPVLFITAYSSVSKVIRAMKAGAYDFIKKPFDIAEFETKVEKALMSKREQEVESEVKSLLSERQKFKKGNILPLLLSSIKHEAQTQGKGVKNIELNVLELLSDYEWPGGEAEFESVIKIAIAHTQGETLSRKDIPTNLLIFQNKTSQEALLAGKDLKEAKEHFKEELLQMLLKKFKGDTQKVNSFLGIKPEEERSE